MQELELLNADKLHISAEKPVKTQVKYLGSIIPKKGHTCFEINMKTKEIAVAQFDDSISSYSKAVKGDYSIKKKIIIKENCIYISALNKMNAIKHLNKMFVAMNKTPV